MRTHPGSQYNVLGKVGLGSGEENRCEGTAAGSHPPCDSQESQRSRRPEEGDAAFSAAAMITLRWPCQAELAVPAPLLGPFERLRLRIGYYFPASSPLSICPALYTHSSTPRCSLLGPFRVYGLQILSGYCLSSNLRHLVIQHGVKFSWSQIYQHGPG